MSAKEILLSLARANIQQAWSCLGINQTELAKQHLREAVEQIEQVEKLSQETKPKVKELTIKV